MTETNLSLDNSDNRKVIIQVMGSRDPAKRRKSNYTIVVPYACLNQTIKQICRTGGTIVDVAIQSSCLPAPTITNKIKVSAPTVNRPSISQPNTVKSITTPIKESVKTDTTSVTISESKEPVKQEQQNVSSIPEVQKKDLLSPTKKSKKTRLNSSRKLVRKTSKSHSTKSRRRAKIYLQ